MYDVFEQLLLKFDVTAYKVGKATGIASSTFTDWKNGKSSPKGEKLQKIADYFGVTVDYLMGIERDENIQYYLNDETKEIAQEIFDNKDLKILFDASRKAKPEDLKFIIEMAKRFKEKD